MSEQDKARERARLLMEWANEKILQGFINGVWSDWDDNAAPLMADPSDWRVKPEPRTVWLADPSGSTLVHVATTPEQAEELRKKHFVVTEWQEVLP